MANTSDFKNGLIINHKNNLWKIVEFLHVKPGKGSAFVRSKLKNIRTGQVVEETFISPICSIVCMTAGIVFYRVCIRLQIMSSL